MNKKEIKFRVMSDLHFDINLNHFPMDFDRTDNDTYTLIAGDICGDIFKTKEHLEEIFKDDKLVFVEGNHIVYSKDDITITDRIEYLKKTFQSNPNYTFLENDFIEIPDTDIIIVGATFWTNWKLNGDSEEYISKRIALRMMNDYRFGKMWDETKYNIKTRFMTPDDTQRFNNKSFEYIQSIINNNPSKKVVILTHHAPSPSSLNYWKYGDNSLNPAYASDYSKFILDNPNIKLWVHGHVHENKDYMIGQCRVVCNPLGYTVYDENPSFDKNLIIKI